MPSQKLHIHFQWPNDRWTPRYHRQKSISFINFGQSQEQLAKVAQQRRPSQLPPAKDVLWIFVTLDANGACGHLWCRGVQNSMEANLACRPALSTEWLDWAAILCKLLMAYDTDFICQELPLFRKVESIWFHIIHTANHKATCAYIRQKHILKTY